MNAFLVLFLTICGWIGVVVTGVSILLIATDKDNPVKRAVFPWHKWILAFLISFACGLSGCLV